MGSRLSRSDKAAESDKFSKADNEDNIFTGALNRQTMSILLIFGKDDKQGLAFLQAAKQAKYKCSIARSIQSVASFCLEQAPNVIIADARETDKVENLCKIFGSMSNKEGIVLVAVRNSVKPENSLVDPNMVPLIKVGFTRQFLQNFDAGTCLTELQFIEYGELQTRFQFQMARSFITAVENSNDSIEITSRRNNIMYVNGAFEQLFGCPKKEAIGKTFLSMNSCALEMDKSIVDSMKAQMRQGIAWKGIFSTCNKNGKTVSHRCNAIPIVGLTGHIENFVIIRKDIGAKTSVNVIKRISLTEGKSHGTLKIEAPMTKVIQTIIEIQETCPPSVAESLDKVLEMLKLTELYIPTIKVDDLDNEMTNELLKGLMKGPEMQRALEDSSTHTVTDRNVLAYEEYLASISLLGANRMSPKVRDLLEQEDRWDFNIIELEALTDKKALQYLAVKTCMKFKAMEVLKIDLLTLYQWFRMIESHYKVSNPYHNSTHAGDVVQASSYLLNLDCITDILGPDEKVAVILAAAVHDIDHPGKTNAYLINSSSPLALLYNDLSVLESHHVSYAFRLTHQDARINIFKNLKKEDYKNFRQQIIDLVLATEMSKHMEHLSRFMHSIIDQPDDHASSKLPTGPVVSENNTIIKRMLIKCSDISNSARPRHLAIIWAERIAEEYFQQTDDEKAQGLPVVMPHFDRHICNIPKTQLSFMSLFINDLFEVWHTFCKIPELIGHIRSNYEYWKVQEKKLQSAATKIQCV